MLSISPWQKSRRRAAVVAASNGGLDDVANPDSTRPDPVVIVEFDPRSGAVVGGAGGGAGAGAAEAEVEAEAGGGRGASPVRAPSAAPRVAAAPPRLVERRYAGVCVLAVLPSGGVVGHLLDGGKGEGGEDPVAATVEAPPAAALSFRLSVSPPPPSEALDCSYTDDSYPAVCSLRAFGRRGELAFGALASGGDAPRLEGPLLESAAGGAGGGGEGGERSIGERVVSIRVVTETILVRCGGGRRTRRSGEGKGRRRAGGLRSFRARAGGRSKRRSRGGRWVCADPKALRSVVVLLFWRSDPAAARSRPPRPPSLRLPQSGASAAGLLAGVGEAAAARAGASAAVGRFDISIEEQVAEAEERKRAGRREKGGGLEGVDDCRDERGGGDGSRDSDPLDVA